MRFALFTHYWLTTKWVPIEMYDYTGATVPTIWVFLERKFADPCHRFSLRTIIATKYNIMWCNCFASHMFGCSMDVLFTAQLHTQFWIKSIEWIISSLSCISTYACRCDSHMKIEPLSHLHQSYAWPSSSPSSLSLSQSFPIPEFVTDSSNLSDYSDSEWWLTGYTVLIPVYCYSISLCHGGLSMVSEQDINQ